MISDILRTAASEATYANMYKEGTAALVGPITTFDGYLGKAEVTA